MASRKKSTTTSLRVNCLHHNFALLAHWQRRNTGYRKRWGYGREHKQGMDALEACQRGCEFFSRIEFRNGVQEPLNSLRNCNYSKCNIRFYQSFRIGVKFPECNPVVSLQAVMKDLKDLACLPANQAVGSTLTMVSPILLLLLHKSLHRDQTSSEPKISSSSSSS